MTRAADETIGFAIFCDDIREEINSKTTLVGLYGGEMLVAATGPAMIPQLCFMGKVIFNRDAIPNSISIVLKRFGPDGEMPELGRVDLPTMSELPIPPISQTYGGHERRLQIQAALRMSPVSIENDFTIRPVLTVDGVDKSMGSLTVRLVETLS
jgi:hypothetical protein